MILRYTFALLSGMLLYSMLFAAHQALGVLREPTVVGASGVSTQLSPTSEPTATVLFGGDMMFDRGVRLSILKRGEDYLLSCIEKTLNTADLVVANLEGPITKSPSISMGSTVGSEKNYVFTFPTTTATLLARYHVGLVNLGNNHTLNFGRGGELSTKTHLTQAGVKYFGDHTSASVAYEIIQGIPLAFINYNEFGGSASTTVEQITFARGAGYLPVVFTHWGVEYAAIAPRYIRDLASRFVDVGAILVVGSHPHVVQDHELYKGVPIYYSLGNFIFDQHFSEAVTSGLLLRVVFNSTGVASIEELPIVIEPTNRPCLAT